MPEHNTLTGSALHQPKGIDSAGTSDSGKVLTPSASVAGTGVLRRLIESEIDQKVCYVTVAYENIDSVGDIYIPMGFAGTVTKVTSAINGALGTSDTILTVKINGTAMTGGTLLITSSGSAAGDVDSCTPTALNVFTEGQYIQVTSDTAGTGSVTSTLMFTITRS